MSEAAIWGVGVIEDDSGFPDASNTGVPAGTSLTAYAGPTTITANDTVIDSKIISGCLTIQATGVVITKSQISCDTTLQVIDMDGGDLTLEDCELDCGGLTGNGFSGPDLVVRRCDISGCENGFNVDGNLTLEDSYLHDMVFEEGAHTDGLQFNQGASNISIVHNTIVAVDFQTSCIIMWDGGDPQGTNILIEDNRLIGTGAGYTIYTPRPDDPLTNVSVINNRMIPGGFGYNGGYGWMLTDGSGNVNDDTGDPISIGWP